MSDYTVYTAYIAPKCHLHVTFHNVHIMLIESYFVNYLRTKQMVCRHKFTSLIFIVV